MTANNLPELKTAPNHQMGGGVWVGILLVLLGAVAIFTPFFSSVIVETWIGLILASGGLSSIVYAFQTREEDGFIWKLLLGLLYMATGVLLFVYPLTGVLTLTLLLGSFLLTEGTFEVILAFRLRPNQNWIWVLINGIVTIGLGVLVWLQWPNDSAWVLGTVVGASVISTGISRIGMYSNRASIDPASPTPKIDKIDQNPSNNPAA
jgi:uncharacterized membrane protein HdeD (DUF308 family)